jgi:tRNA1Val (adenine37-N6)-methyltransferase
VTGDWTEDRLLNGRVLLRQPRAGLRAGLDAVLLAAAVPARAEERVLEAGCGSGAAFLCLAARVPGLAVCAVEREAGLAELAAANAAANGIAAQVSVTTGDIGDAALAGALPAVAHAFANPPYWPGGTPPPGGLRARATHAGAGLGAWTRFLATPLRAGGTLTLILPAARLAAGMAALEAAGCGAIRVLPCWPRSGVAAKRVILQGRKGRRGPSRIEPGLVLHEAGGFSAAAEAVLRDAAPL